MSGLVFEDILLEAIRSIVLAIIWLGLLRYRHARLLAGEPGWHWLLTGFGLVFLGSLFDLSDNFPSLNPWIIVGDTPAEAFLEKFVGYLGGFIAIAIGIHRWLPAMVQAQKQLRQIGAQSRRPLLEPTPGKDTADLSGAMAWLRENEAFLDAVLNTMLEGLIVLDAQLRIVYANPEAEHLLQWDQEPLMGHSLTALLPDESPDAAGGVLAAVQAAFAQSAIQRLEEARLQRRGTEPMITRLAIAPVTVQQRRMAVLTFEDITERMQLEQALQHQATHDPLTGLYNRREMYARLEQELARARRYGEPLAVVMLDIDHFKAINDHYGHQVGDAVLQGLAQRLLQQARKADVVARYGGEEFLLILPRTDLAAAGVFAERLRELIAGRPFGTRAGELSILVSIGVAAYPDQAADSDGLIRAADTALYTAKQHGRNRVVTGDIASALRADADNEER